ncbi:MAG: M15 family metallopeptidase [Candidatus Tumulicola sp.]
MRRSIALLVVLACGAATGQVRPGPPRLPAGFAYLSDVAPTVVQDIRYAGSHNVLGRPVPGYLAPACVLTQRAARALAQTQEELLAAGLTLRVYDCYRPQRAVNAMLAWSKNAPDQRMKGEDYPRVDKGQIFALGYLSSKSAHTRGSAVDLTIERLAAASPLPWVAGRHSCIAPFVERYHDGSIDMGTNYDCMDPLSRTDAPVGGFAGTHRAMLRGVMEKHGFIAQKQEAWWHFTLRSEPFPKTYFDFPVTSK